MSDNLNGNQRFRDLYYITPAVGFLLVEILANWLQDFEWVYVTVNILFFGALLLLLWLFSGTLRRASVLLLCGSELFGIINHYVLRFRGRGLYPTDLLAWQTALNVAREYDYTPDFVIFLSLAICIAFLILLFRLAPDVPLPLRKKPLKRVGAEATVVLLGVALYWSGPYLPPEVSQWNPQEQGSLLTFIGAIPYMRAQPPKLYDQLDSIVSSLPTTNDSEHVTRPENILVIMDEAYMDCSIYPYYEAPEPDPYAFFHSLRDSGDSILQGYLYAPVTGGGTAATEFESLTGLSDIITRGNVAYMLYVRDTIPSLADAAKAQGYRASAFHPYLSSGWNRPFVYNCMGFDEQTYISDLDPNTEKVRDLIADRADFQWLIRQTQEREAPQFFFNVTVQNHSGYVPTGDKEDLGITLPDGLIDDTGETRQYFQCIHATDQALEELITYYRSCEEPTLIVFWGDHQVEAGADYYPQIERKLERDFTLEEIMRRYLVPCFIWANYDLPQEVLELAGQFPASRSGLDGDFTASTLYLPCLISRAAGLPETPYLKYLEELSERLPVLNRAGIQAADGTWYETQKDLPEDLRQDYETLLALSYNGLFEPLPLFFHNNAGGGAAPAEG